MEQMNETFAVILGFVLRLGIPILITALVILFLKRIDTRWKEDAASMSAESMKLAVAKGPRCWDVKNCSPEQRANCIAYKNQDIPCWQHYRQQDGSLREGCLGCDYFRKVPVLAGA